MKPGVAAAFRLLAVVVVVVVLGRLVSIFIPKRLDLVHDIQCLLWLVTAVCSVFLFRRIGGWPSVLLVVGSIAFFVMHAETQVASYAMESGWIPADSPLWQRWGFFVWDTTFSVAMLCFPVGVVWYLFRATAPNQTLEPTADRLENYEGEIRK